MPCTASSWVGKWTAASAALSDSDRTDLWGCLFGAAPLAVVDSHPGSPVVCETGTVGGHQNTRSTPPPRVWRSSSITLRPKPCPWRSPTTTMSQSTALLKPSDVARPAHQPLPRQKLTTASLPRNNCLSWLKLRPRAQKHVDQAAAILVALCKTDLVKSQPTQSWGTGACWTIRIGITNFFRKPHSAMP